MRWRGAGMELEILAEHAEKMLFEPHHERMHPSVEQHVRALEAHLRRIARREILHVDRSRNHGAGNAEALGDMALHLRAEHQFRMRLAHPRLDFEVILGDKRLDAVELGGIADFAGEFAGVCSEPDDGEAEFLRGDARGGERMRRVAENEDALARQVGRVDGARIPGKPRRAAGCCA